MPAPCDPWRSAAAGAATSATSATSAAAVPPLRPGPYTKVIAVATHLDEDLCAAGGLLGALADGGASVNVLAVTDDDGSDELRGERRRHRLARCQAAYPLMGLHYARRYRLGLTSGTGIDPYDVESALSELVGYDDPAKVLIVAPWEHDGRCDHDLVGGVAAAVGRAYRVGLVRYLTASWWRPLIAPSLPRRRLRSFRPPAALRERKDSSLAHLVPGAQRLSGVAAVPRTAPVETYLV